MKKFFLMLAAIPALCMVSCSKDNNPDDNPGNNPGGNNTTDNQAVLSEAIYYGEKLVNGFGYYSMTFEKGDQTLRLDVFGSVATDSSAASITGGDYTLTSVNSPANRTYFLAENTSDEVGTLLWNGNTPVLVTGGKVTVNVGPSGYRVTLALTAGGETIDWVYNGRISFVDQYERAPRQPIVADRLMIAYLGQAEGSSLGTLLINIGNSSAPNTILRAYMTIPLPEDSERIEIPTGTFEISENTNQPNKIEPGYITSQGIGGSLEYELTSAGYLKSAVVLESGTLTITQEGPNSYRVRTDFAGTRVAGGSSIVNMGPEAGVIYDGVISGTPDYVTDYSKPESNLTEDLDVSDMGLVNMFYDGWVYDEASTQLIFRFVFYSDSLEISRSSGYEQDAVLWINGTGDFVSLQVTGGMVSDINAVLDGTYPMYGKYDYTYEENTTRPAMPGESPAGALDIYSGCWYGNIYEEAGSLYIGTYAGFIADEGVLTLTPNTDYTILTVELDGFKDRNGNTISGKFEVELDLEPSSDSVMNAAPEMNVMKLPALPAGAIRIR